MEEKIERYKNTDFECPICGYKLGFIQQEPSRRLDYVCSSEDCQAQIFFDKTEDQWYVREKRGIPEPKIWKPKKQI